MTLVLLYLGGALLDGLQRLLRWTVRAAVLVGAILLLDGCAVGAIPETPAEPSTPAPCVDTAVKVWQVHSCRPDQDGTVIPGSAGYKSVTGAVLLCKCRR